MPITILIAEEQELLRETWKSLLSTVPRSQVLVTCYDGKTAVEKTKKLNPKIVIMDINLQGVNGIEATRLIRHSKNETKILGCSLHGELLYADKIIAERAIGYITKTATIEEMSIALLALDNNEYYLSEEIKPKKASLGN
jgi:DNA-binding NarL/FixJ family response regulator